MNFFREKSENEALRRRGRRLSPFAFHVRRYTFGRKRLVRVALVICCERVNYARMIFSKFSSTIRFTSSKEPGKNACARKVTTSTRVVDGKKLVTKSNSLSFSPRQFLHLTMNASVLQKPNITVKKRSKFWKMECSNRGR